MQLLASGLQCQYSAKWVALLRAGMRASDFSGAKYDPCRTSGPKPLGLNPVPARRVIRFAPLSGGAHAPAFAAPSADGSGAGSGGGMLAMSSPVDIPRRGARPGERDGRCGTVPVL